MSWHVYRQASLKTTGADDDCSLKAGSHIIAAIVSIASIVCNLRGDRKRHKRLGAIRGFSYNRPDRLV